MTTSAHQKSRGLRKIALEVLKDWSSPYFGALPYLDAMLQLDGIDEDFGRDSGRSIVHYFLVNATMWRGDVARRVKAELRRMLR